MGNLGEKGGSSGLAYVLREHQSHTTDALSCAYGSIVNWPCRWVDTRRRAESARGTKEEVSDLELRLRLGKRWNFLGFFTTFLLGLNVQLPALPQPSTISTIAMSVLSHDVFHFTVVGCTDHGIELLRLQGLQAQCNRAQPLVQPRIRESTGTTRCFKLSKSD